MNAETKAAPAAEAFTASEFERLLDKAVQRVERAAAPQVQPMELRTFAELERWAERAADSDMVPKDYRGKPTNIILAVQMGAEIGLRPMQSLQNIMVNNGRPSIWGDAMLALCKGHPAYVSIQETLAGEGEKMEARCVVIRRGEPPFVTTFSVDDAKTAKLWMKKGYNGTDTPWVTSPKRMLQMRARGFALRDAFPDKLKGLISVEEAQDYPEQPPYVPPASAAPPPAPRQAPVEFKPPPTKLTFTQWFADIEKAFATAPDKFALEAICEVAENAKVIALLTDERKKRFTDLLDAALDRAALRGEAVAPHVAKLRADEAELDGMLGGGMET